jgi:hypothetical protein
MCSKFEEKKPNSRTLSAISLEKFYNNPTIAKEKQVESQIKGNQEEVNKENNRSFVNKRMS